MNQSQINQSLCLLDENFLATLSEQKDRELFARIIALDINENPIDQIEGRISNGSINIDGSSIVRRTCSLTMITDDVDINNFYWGIKTKFKLEIGLKNKLMNQYAPGPKSAYPEIMWFPQGYYIVSTFNTTISTNNCTISLQGKDKMCMLNGDLGGQLYASIDFGTEEEVIYSMEEVIFKNQENSSEGLRQYYLKIDRLDSNDQQSYLINTFPTPEEKNIYQENSKNPLYIFIYNKSNEGHYYKEGNKYTFLDEGEVAPLNCKTYDCYKAITDPNQLYVRTGTLTDTYKSSTYYYKKNNDDNYYILDTAATPTSDRVYYILKTVFKRKENLDIQKIKIEKIIKEAVHTYAQEPYHNIIINDLDDYGLEQLTYKGDTDLYALYNVAFGQFTNLAISGKVPELDTIINDNNNFIFYSLNESTNSLGTLIKMDKQNNQYSFESITEEEFNNLTNIEEKTKIYAIAKISYGMDIGYRLTDLVYSGDLICGIGETITSVLDKIKQMLGDFEYFYDLNGRFIFQKKKTYVETSWSQLTNNEDEDYVSYGNEKQKFSFNFEGNRLISSIQNTPALNNLKNDFVVWGKRKDISGAEIPIHARYSIDKKPTYYKTLDGRIYSTDIEYILQQNHLPNIDIDYIKNFTLQNWYPYIGLTKPVKQIDGTWSAGWWNLADWQQYHWLLTGKIPVEEIINYCGATVPLDSIKNLYTLTEEQKNSFINNNTQISFISIDKNTKVTKIITLDNLTFQDLIDNPNNNDYFIYDPQFIGTTALDLIHEQSTIDNIQWLNTHNIYIVDWREIIYQMALDFFLGQGCGKPDQPKLYISHDHISFTEMTDPDHFLYEVGIRNPYYYPTGYTGYEQYYTDMQGFWRQLYNPDYIPEMIYEKGYYEDIIDESSNNTYYTRKKVWTSPTISDCNIEYYVYKNRDDIQQQLTDLNTAINNASGKKKKTLQLAYNDYQTHAVTEENEDTFKRLYWNRAVFETPENLNFWIDFLDSDLELAQFAVSQVGDRTKVVNEDKAGSIIYSEIPNFILYEHTKFGKLKNPDGSTVETTVEVCDESELKREITEKSGYTFIYLPKGFSQYFTISHRNLSVKDKIDSLLYQHGYCTENISLTTIPIYHLQPNTRVYVYDKQSNIDGEYLINKISLSLTYNGTMSITAVKAPERLY